MPDKKLNDNEIKKALEYWKQFDKEIDILIKRYPEEKADLLEQREILKITFGVFDLINRQEKENNRLDNENDELKADIGFLDRENEKLQAENEKNENIIRLADKTIETQNAEIEQLKANSDSRQINECENTNIAHIKAEAYKVFAEQVQGEIDDAIHSNYNAKEERQEKCKRFGIPIAPDDSFLMYCDGKIHALSGLQSFIDNLFKELVGEDG